MGVLVVGVGLMGQLHAKTVRSSRFAELSGVVDRTEGVATAVGDELGVPAFTDLDRALEQIRPDAVIIATPDPSHRPPAQAAIEAGAAVLVEKPLATTVEDAEAITALAGTRGVRLMTGHITRFYPRYVQVAEAVHSGRLGKPLLVTTSTWGLTSLGARVADTTNPLWHFAIHDLDLIHWITGGVVERVDGAQFIDADSGASAFTATGTVTGGASFNVSTGWTLPDSATPRWDLKVHCERGVAEAAWSHDGVTLYTSGGAEHADCLAWPTLYGQIQGALRLEVEHFLTALADDTPFAITPEQAVDAVRAAALLEKSAVRRTR